MAALGAGTPAAGQPVATPSAAALPPLALIQKQLRDARAEQALNLQLLAQPEIADGAKHALKNRSESLAKSIARLRELEQAVLAQQRPASAPATEVRP